VYAPDKTYRKEIRKIRYASHMRKIAVTVTPSVGVSRVTVILYKTSIDRQNTVVLGYLTILTKRSL